MTHCKYIIWSASEYVMFPASMSHHDVAGLHPGRTPESGGFANFVANKDGSIGVVTFGESVSLGVQSKESDAKILKWMLNPY